MKGNTGAVGKKPDYSSDFTPPKGADVWMNERGPLPTKPVDMSTKEYSTDGNHFHGK